MNSAIRIIILLFLIYSVKSFGQTVALDSFHNPQYQSRIIKYRKLQIGIVGAIGILQLPKAPAARNIEYFEKFGSAAGIHLQYNLKRNAALTLNCLYEQKNWNSSNINYSGNYQKSDNTFHELTFPLLFKYSPFYRNFFVSAGPYLGIILKKEVKGLEEGNYVYQNPFEAGATLGIGFNIPISNRISIILEGRDYINVKTSKALSDYTKMNTATLQFGAFYKFGKTEQIVIKKQTDSISGKKVFVKLFYSPHYSYRLRNKQDIRYGRGANFDYGGYSSKYFIYNPEIETPKMTSEFGILMEFRLSKHINLNIGNTLNHEGYSTKKSDFTVISAYQMTSSSVIYRDTTIIKNQSINFDYYFLSTPIIINYQYKIKKHFYYVGIGIHPQILTKHELQFSEAKDYNYLLKNNYLSEEKKIKYIEAVTLFYSANIGVAFSLGEKIFLFLEPECKIEIKEMPNTPRLWSAGCRLGIKF